jgi:hypothetical protein
MAAIVMLQLRIAAGAVPLLLLGSVVWCQQAAVRAVSSSAPSSGPQNIVIGFVGGFISHDNAVHGGVKLAARLREDYPSGVYVKVFENRHGDAAHREILRLLDTDHDGTLSSEEKQRARIVIYGHSWGGSETVALARQLEKDGVPVLLTVQVDSVGKIGENDEVIPPNVAQAVNFFQLNGMLHGRAKIRAADSSRTQIIGNYQYDYAKNPVTCRNYPWLARLLENPHIEIECDPGLLDHIEALIRSKLPPATRDNLSRPASQ